MIALVFILVFFAQFDVAAAYSKKADGQASLLELQNSYSTLQHQLSNNKSEIKTFEERLLNFEVMLETLRDEISLHKDQQKEVMQSRGQSLELRIANLENANKAIASDIKQLSASLTQLEGTLAKQNKNFANLQNAVSSLLEAFQDKPDGITRYTVKNGDSLEKIARAHQTTVQAIKEHNGLTTDRIIVGKKIKIPMK